MIYFGIDPGTAHTGFGVISTGGSRIELVDCGVVSTKASAPLPDRLLTIYDGLSERMRVTKPDVVCIEEAFYGKNVHTTLVLGHARGVAMLAARQCGALVTEFAPTEVKKNLTGNGLADKTQVEYMIKVILGMKDASFRSDAYDALAVAICGFNMAKATAALQRRV